MRKRVLIALSATAMCLAVSALFLKVVLPQVFSSNGNLTNSQSAVKESGALQKAQSLFDSGDYLGAVSTIDATDTEKNADLLPIREKSLEALWKKAEGDAWQKIYQYDYAGAFQILKPLEELDKGNNARLKKLYDTCEKFQRLVPYKGTVEHIFYHPLIAYPELTFDGDRMEKGFDDFFVTVPEFNKVMQRMYKANYILIDIRLLYEVQKDGTVKKKNLMLPEGKKPLIMSIDDLNFYKYMRINGMVHGFALNDSGNVVTYTVQKDGTRAYADNNEIVPIMDNMVKDYPDFVFGGHKGTIALTGYEGALGFPTDLMDAPDYPKVLAEAKAIADHLKATGWNFASHSYGHNSPKKRSLKYISDDTSKWLKEVTPVVGATDVYIYPFGELIDFKDPKHLQMVEKGFKMFCGVQKSPYIRYYDKWVLMQRRTVDGIAFYGDRLSDMIDTKDLIDPVRPKRSN